MTRRAPSASTRRPIDLPRPVPPPVMRTHLSFRRSLWNMERSLVTPPLQELVPLRRRFGYGDTEGNRIQGRPNAAAGGELPGADGEGRLAGARALQHRPRRLRQGGPGGSEERRDG